MSETTATAPQTSNSDAADTKAQQTEVSSQKQPVEANKQQETEKDSSVELINKLAQERADKIAVKLNNENAKLQKEIAKLKKEKLSSEELTQLEISERESEIAEREKQVKIAENKIYAIKAIKEIGLDDGSENSLQLVDFIVQSADAEENEIDEKVKAFSDLVNSFVSKRVEAMYKEHGRSPRGGDPGEDRQIKENNVAQTLGKRAAERNNQTQNILNHYLKR